MWKRWVTTTAVLTSNTRRARCAESHVSKPAWSVKMSSAGMPSREQDPAHRADLVVLDAAVVARQQQLVDAAGLVELVGGADAVREHALGAPLGITCAPSTSAACACGTLAVSVVTGSRPPSHTIRFGTPSATITNPAAMASARLIGCAVSQAVDRRSPAPGGRR